METRDKDQVVYYYDRSRRLEKASPNARFISEFAGSGRRGVIRSMISNRSLVFMFAAVLLALAALFGGNWVQSSRASGTIGGSRLSVKAMWFEGYVYVTVKRGTPGPDSPLKAISIRAELDSQVAEGILQAVDAEYRFRLPAAGKTGTVSVVAGLAGADGAVAESITMVAVID
jgi:hypothetical protein